MHQIPCAGSVFGVYRSTIGQARDLKFLHFRTEQVQLLNEFLPLRMIRVLHDRFVPVATPLCPEELERNCCRRMGAVYTATFSLPDGECPVKYQPSSGAGESWEPSGPLQVAKLATYSRRKRNPRYGPRICDIHHCGE